MPPTQSNNASGADAYRESADIVATLRPTRPNAILVALILLALWGLVAWIYQMRYGLAVTAMNNYFSWGIYIVNFVFFIGISMAGTLISAMLRLLGAHWRHPITRLAEGITLFSLLVAAPMIIIDMGRPDRFHHVFLYGRFQSPILWDMLSLNTYLMGSILYLYLPMIPDMAILRDHARDLPAWRRRLYAILALNWQGTLEQQHRLERCISIMALIIIPVAVSIHTVTAWIFGMTLRPGWHTSILGPDFVVGALYSGIAAVITAMALFRSFFHLHRLITVEHFKRLAILLLAVGLVYLYFTINEYVGSGYNTQGAEEHHLKSIFLGNFSFRFWTMIVVGLAVPLTLLSLPWTHNIKCIVTASVLINIGMWLMRYIIVVPTLSSPMMPTPTGVRLAYAPTWVEWSITAGGFAAFASMYILFSKVFPIISIWEVSAAAHQAESHPAQPRVLAVEGGTL